MKKKLHIINLFIVGYMIVVGLSFFAYDIWSDYHARKEYLNPVLNTPPPPTMTPVQERVLKIHVTIPYWEQERAGNVFREQVSKIDYLSLFWYTLNDKQKIVPYKDAVIDDSIIAYAKQNNVKVLALITNLPDFDGSEWDSDRVRALIRNQQTRKAHITEILRLLNSKGFDGVNIDYEELDDDLRGEYSSFIQELSTELHKEGKIVSVAIHPKSTEYLPAEDNGSRAQDWQIIANHADHLYFMTYGEHWNTSIAGPIASIPWDAKIISYAKRLELPMQKVYLGMPLYAVRWQEGTRRGEGLVFEDVKNIQQQYNVQPVWSETFKSPNLKYSENNKNYVVWFENSRSIKEKLNLAVQSGVGGLTFWHIGGEDPQVWNLF